MIVNTSVFIYDLVRKFLTDLTASIQFKMYLKSQVSKFKIVAKKKSLILGIF